MFPTNAKKANAMVPRTQKTRENSEKMVASFKTKDIMSEGYVSNINFKYCNSWFSSFCKCNGISPCHKTHVAQKSPATLKKCNAEVSCKVLVRKKPRQVLSVRHSKHGSNTNALGWRSYMQC